MQINTENGPIISICCVTYNHGKFIRQCLDGFIMQETSYKFEILVHDDASNDNTSCLLKKYEKDYPHLFCCVYQTTNQFKIQNTLANILFPMAKGKYIAMCEGDDYWTDPHKLQKQVNFLENNPEYAICYHRVNEIDDNGKMTSDIYNPSIVERTYTIDDLALGNFIHTPGEKL